MKETGFYEILVAKNATYLGSEISTFNFQTIYTM